VLVLNFHRIEPPSGLEINRLGPARFRRVLDLIDRTGLGVAKTGTDSLAAGNEVLLTFDDGFASVARNALPELQYRRWGAIVFLIAASVGTTDDWEVRLIGRPRMMMDWDDICEWSKAGIEFGSHTMTHADLTSLTDRALRVELSESKAVLEGKLGRTVRYLSYPFGRHNVRVRDAARQAGYEAAFATGGTDWDRCDHWAIPRIGINALTSMFEIQSMLQAAADRGGAEGETWRRYWHGRVFEALNAGSAAVGNWRRSRQTRNGAQYESDPVATLSRSNDNRNAPGTAGLRSGK